MTKAAAILALVVTLLAAGCLVYEATVIRDGYRSSVSACMSCTTAKEAATANWEYVQSQVQLLKAQGKNREAEKFAQDHAGDRPVNTDVPCSDCNTPAPDYTAAGAVTIVGLIASVALFGVKPKK